MQTDTKLTGKCVSFIYGTINNKRFMDQVINIAVVPLFAAQQQLTLMHDGATTQRWTTPCLPWQFGAAMALNIS